MKFKTLSKSIRLPFLVLTPVCLLLGWSPVIAHQTQVGIHLFILSFLGAVLAHIAVNTLNEYWDFKSGLDLNTQRTQFSGGSGVLPDHPEMATSVLTIGILSSLAVVIIGLFFVWEYNWKIIPLGISGLFLIATYTGWINKHPLLCLVAPGIGFGLLMVAGANFALTGEYSASLLLISLVPFFLVNNLLLLNQYPDIDADRKAGRNHFPIAYGVKTASIMYGIFAVMTIVVIISLVLIDTLPLFSLIALLPTPLAFFSLSGAIKYGAAIGSYPQYLGANVAVTIIVPTMLAASIIFGL